MPAGNGFYPGYLHEIYDFSFHPFRGVGYDICRASEMGLNGYYYPFFSSPVFDRSPTNFARPIMIGSYKYENSKLASWFQYDDYNDYVATYDSGHTNYGDCIEFYVPTSIPLLAITSQTNSAGFLNWTSPTDSSNKFFVPGKNLALSNYVCQEGFYETSWATAIAQLFFLKLEWNLILPANMLLS